MNKILTQFLLSWDHLGLEACINVTAIEKEEAWNILKGDQTKNRLQHTISMMMMRARINSQRHYEIYLITVNDGISEEDLRKMFEVNPQNSANLIRERGVELFSNRLEHDTIKIV